jgi:hypothetical protein
MGWKEEWSEVEDEERSDNCQGLQKYKRARPPPPSSREQIFKNRLRLWLFTSTYTERIGQWIVVRVWHWRASVCDPITNKKAQALTRLGSPLTRQELIDKV